MVSEVSVCFWSFVSEISDTFGHLSVYARECPNQQPTRPVHPQRFRAAETIPRVARITWEWKTCRQHASAAPVEGGI